MNLEPESCPHPAARRGLVDQWSPCGPDCHHVNCRDCGAIL